MYCPKCGLDNLEDEKLCISCGTALPVIPDLPPEISKTSKLAIWSFVLSLFGLFTFMVTALPAIICGIVGLVKISNSNGRLRGKGYAITGIVVPVVYIFLILPIMLGLLMPLLGNVRYVAQRQMCLQNLTALGVAMKTYANEHNDTYPAASNWCEELKPYVSRPEAFICPASKAQKGQSSYAINIKVAGKKISEIPPDTVILFETTPAANPAGEWELCIIKYHRPKGCNILFADGHVEFVQAEKLLSLF